MSAYSDPIDLAFALWCQQEFGRFRILLVDDDPYDRELTRNVIQQIGAEVVEVSNAEDALINIESGNIGLVISDVVMPGMSGIELRVILSKEHPHLPVLLATSFDHILRELVRRADIHDLMIVKKPLELISLRSILMQLGKPINEPERISVTERVAIGHQEP